MKNESEIIELFCSNPQSYNLALAYVYRSPQYKDPVYAFLKSKGLQKDDCHILWTDIVVKFGVLVKNGTYKHQGKMMGYIKNLANYMMLNYFRSQRKNSTVELDTAFMNDQTVEASTMYYSELKTMLNVELLKMGEICKKTLFLWAEGYSMKEIMQKMSFVSLESTRKRKHTCMKKLLKHVDNNDNLHNTLKDYYHAISK